MNVRASEGFPYVLLTLILKGSMTRRGDITASESGKDRAAVARRGDPTGASSNACLVTTTASSFFVKAAKPVELESPVARK